MQKILKAENKLLFNLSSAIVVDENWFDMCVIYVMNVVRKMEGNEHVDVAIVFEMYWNEYDINDVDEEGENVR
jgi:TRAP-type mannitol/chloroaromatic compound transport system permease small subunit